MSLQCCSMGVNVLSIVCFVFLLCHWCKHYVKLLESKRHLGNRDLGFWAVYFAAQLNHTAAQKTEIYLVSETEDIDQKHVLLREDKHASFILCCQFSLPQKAPQQGWELWDDSISAPTTDKQIFLNGIFVRRMNFDHLCSPYLKSTLLVMDGIVFFSNVNSCRELISGVRTDL